MCQKDSLTFLLDIGLTSIQNTFTFFTVPTTVTDMRNHSVIEGRNLTLECDVGGSSPVVSWTHINSVNRVSKNGKTWIIRDITTRDHGEYICEARNFCGHDRKGTYVDVKCEF